jgi:hypothetical protein
MGVRNRRAARPTLERVETRELLSGIGAVLATAQTPPVSAATALAQRLLRDGWAVVDTGSGSGTTVATTTIPTGTVSASAINTGGTTLPDGNSFVDNTNSPLLGNGMPSPHEAAREAFRAGFQGRYYTSPGRFSNQSTTYFYRGTGGSSFFLHGDFNMAIVTPTDPTAQFVGEAVMNDKSTGTSGSLGLVLVGNRNDGDRLGRPTHMTFTADPNIYSGVFAVAAAEGTVDIRYGAGPKKETVVTFNGRVYTSGLTSPLVNTDMYARHGRPLVLRGPAAIKRF